MKWAAVWFGVLLVVASSGCWRPLNRRYAQPAYPQAPAYAPPPTAYPVQQVVPSQPMAQPAPIMQPAPIAQPTTIVQQPMMQNCQPVYCQPCPPCYTPCY